jgi:ATP-dependent RNA helicase DHX37/DHR1
MPPPPRHERYNAKARGSVAGGSSHKKRKRPPPKEVQEDGNDGAGEGEDESLAAIAKRMSGGEGISGKRRKRLESYIVSWPVLINL